MTHPNPDIILAYRHLHKHLLRAVKYSTPSRYTVRDRIRVAFRTQPIERFDPVRIARTLEFLDAASKNLGTEHKILKNWTHVWYQRQRMINSNHRVKGEKEKKQFRREAYDEYDRMVKALEDSMGLCLS